MLRRFTTPHAKSGWTAAHAVCNLELMRVRALYSQVRQENHESGVRYTKLLTPEERQGLASVIDQPPYYMVRPSLLHGWGDGPVLYALL